MHRIQRTGTDAHDDETGDHRDDGQYETATQYTIYTRQMPVS